MGLHLAVSSNYTGSQYYRDEDPGFMWVTINVIQDPRNAPATMVYDGVFEPKGYLFFRRFFRVWLVGTVFKRLHGSSVAEGVDATEAQTRGCRVP